MPRWTVVHGDQELVIEAIEPGGLISLIPTSGQFVGNAEAIRDLRTKLGLAIGEASQGESL